MKIILLIEEIENVGETAFKKIRFVTVHAPDRTDTGAPASIPTRTVPPGTDTGAPASRITRIDSQMEN
ncbi:MAG: hypothetical protein GY757_53090 [bacterium]|nr:hypothetical protein [bacterium]